MAREAREEGGDEEVGRGGMGWEWGDVGSLLWSCGSGGFGCGVARARGVRFWVAVLSSACV